MRRSRAVGGPLGPDNTEFSGEAPSRSASLVRCNSLFDDPRRTPTKAENIAVRALDVEVLGAPRRGCERLHDRNAIRDALFVERFDSVDAGRCVEMLVVAPPLSLRLVLGRFLQVNFQSVDMTDRVESIPRLAEAEADLLVVRNRALKVVDEELWSEGRHAWLRARR